MCGISGYVLKRSTTDTELLKEMTHLIRHRGPDDEGYFLCNPQSDKGKYFSGNDSPADIKGILPFLRENILHRVGFGHRRYSIIATSSRGHQPMQLGDITISYNGEIYNYIELRDKLRAKNYTFKTQTDTEVFIAAYQEYGTDCFKLLRGQFAVAIYDKGKQKVILARDQIGKSPLYFIENETGYYFSSDIKPLLAAVPDTRKKINTLAVSDFLYSGIRDFGHQTFWEDIYSLPSGSFCELDLKTFSKKQDFFYQLPQERLTTKDISFEEALPIFSQHLQKSLDIRMRADLQIGFTLSGGMDSSALLALYCNTYSKPVPAITVKFDNPQYNEEPYACQVAEHLGPKIEYTVINGLEKNLLHELDYFVGIAEEPFLSPNSYTGLHLQRILKDKGIGINMYGAGGDELLAGYPSYLKQYLSHLKSENSLSFTELGGIARMLLGGQQGFSLLSSFAKKRLDYGKTSKIKAVLSQVFTKNKYRNIQPSNDFREVMLEKFSNHQMNYWMRDSNKYFMAVPVEMRAPFLDVDLVNFCFQLPPEYLIHKGWQKYILRKAMENLLPKSIVWRKYKMGFPFDLNYWLKANESVFLALIGSLDGVPFINFRIVFKNYTVILRYDSALLWRIISYGLWYKKMIQEESLHLR